MNVFKQIGEDFRSIFVDSYKDGVETAAAPTRVIYLNPNELQDPDMSKNVAKLRESLEKQYPGCTGKPGDKDYTSDADLQSIVELSTTKGPFAIRAEMNGQPLGIVNLQDKSLDHKNEIFPLMTGIPLSKMREIPGSDYMWDKVIGIHEGTHVKQPEIDPNLPQQEIDRLTLQHEAEADRAAMKYLKDLGRDDMLQAWKDYRALAAGNDPDHATSIYMGDDKPIVVTDQQMAAARNFRPAMDQIVATELGIPVADAEKLLDSDPKKYIGAIDKVRADGSLDLYLAQPHIAGSPEMKQFIEDYAGAYRRQVIEKELEKPKPVRHGPRAEIDLPKDVQWAALPDRGQTMRADAANDSNIEIAAAAPVELKPAEAAAATPAIFKTTAVIQKPVDLDTINGGKASIVEGDIKDEMRIGGTSASAFFASHARPELAEQRLQRAAELDASVTTPAVNAANDAQFALKA